MCEGGFVIVQRKRKVPVEEIEIPAMSAAIFPVVARTQCQGTVECFSIHEKARNLGIAGPWMEVSMGYWLIHDTSKASWIRGTSHVDVALG